MPYLLLLFIAIPIIEMWLLISISRHIGALLTISLVVATAVIGVHWLRQQGFSTLLKLNERLSAGEMPAREITEGVIITIGGALLLTPGFATDALGFACLFAPSRALLVKSLFSRIQNGIMASAMSASSMSTGSMSSASMSGQASANHSNNTMEGSFTSEGSLSNKPMASSSSPRQQAQPNPMGHINAVFGGRDSANDNKVIDGECSRED
ncbi:MAG TPA: biotin--acetyl-CoA-carboxylase ligase [Cellvibrionales bacterium]|nr:biotin--acetyl-CoA-carboxylase ligase [Cellvibrionales bacterium]